MNFTKEQSKKVKGIAILLLCIHHFLYKEKYYDTFKMKGFLPRKVCIELGVMARVCVPIFVFVSAYGLTLQYLHKKDTEKTGSFIVKRWLILMSGRWFIYPFQLLLAYINGNSPEALYKGKISNAIIDFMGWGDFFSTPMVAGLNWYLFLAQIIIFITPLMCELTVKFDYGSLFITFIMMQLFKGVFASGSGGDYCNYLFAIALGSYIASNQVFDRIKIKNRPLASVITLILAGLFLYLKYRTSKSEFDFKKIQFVILACAALMIVCFVTITFKRCGKVLEFLGEHSGNMFYLHVFILRQPKLHTYIHDIFLYWVVAVIITLLISVIIQLLKKIIRYDKLFKMLLSRMSKPQEALIKS